MPTPLPRLELSSPPQPFPIHVRSLGPYIRLERPLQHRTPTQIRFVLADLVHPVPIVHVDSYIDVPGRLFIAHDLGRPGRLSEGLFALEEAFAQVGPVP